MKLLMCARCQDATGIFLKKQQQVTCFCGQSWARELDDNHVEYGGRGFVLGLFNNDIQGGIDASVAVQHPWPVRAWVLAPGDGALHETSPYCTRCRGTTDQEAWDAHGGEGGAPPKGFKNRGRPETRRGR